MVEVASGMTDASPKSSITIHDRLEAGNFTVDEVWC